MSISVKSTKVRNALFAIAAATAAIGATVGVAEAKHKKHFGVVIDLGSPYYSGYSGYGYGYRFPLPVAQAQGHPYRQPVLVEALPLLHLRLMLIG